MGQGTPKGGVFTPRRWVRGPQGGVLTPRQWVRGPPRGGVLTPRWWIRGPLRGLLTPTVGHGTHLCDGLDSKGTPCSQGPKLAWANTCTPTNCKTSPNPTKLLQRLCLDGKMLCRWCWTQQVSTYIGGTVGMTADKTNMMQQGWSPLSSAGPEI